MKKILISALILSSFFSFNQESALAIDDLFIGEVVFTKTMRFDDSNAGFEEFPADSPGRATINYIYFGWKKQCHLKISGNIRNRQISKGTRFKIRDILFPDDVHTHQISGFNISHDLSGDDGSGFSRRQIIGIFCSDDVQTIHKIKKKVREYIRIELKDPTLSELK